MPLFMQAQCRQLKNAFYINMLYTYFYRFFSLYDKCPIHVTKIILCMFDIEEIITAIYIKSGLQFVLFQRGNGAGKRTHDTKR